MTEINLPFEMEFILNLTYRCNLRCKMCTQYGQNYKEHAIEELNIAEWLNFLNDIKTINPRPKIILMGGEPLLYKDFETLFKTANEYGIKTHIITNGYYLDKYIDAVKDTDTSITVSIDGLYDTHDLIRGQKGLFNKVVNNIEMIDKLQKEGSKVELRINHVMLSENIENMIDFHKFFSRFDIKTFTFQHLQSSTDELNNISQKEWQERLKQDYCMGLIPKQNYILDKNYADNIKNALDKFKNYCHSDNCFVFPALDDDELIDYYTNNNLNSLREHMLCTMPWMLPAINPNGDVSNCIGNIIGNIKNDSFWNIWNNEKAQKLRNCLTENGKFTICTKCCCFYKGNFISAKRCKIEINSIKLELPNELNYIQSSKKVAFVRDNEITQNSEYIPAIPINIHSEEMLNEIRKEYEIITTT